MTKTAAAVAVAQDARFELIPLDRIAESPSNHRRHSWGDMEGLTESIRQKGVVEPILVRPMKGIGSNMFMLVFGARRFRASREAGRTEIPALVRELSDLEVVELQVIENLQRADVHPLEEAEGYEQLLQSKEREYSVDEIAAKVGKSKAYVYGRVKLLALCKEAREAFYEGKFTASSAILVARLPDHGVQRAVLKDLDRRGDREGAWSLHEVSWAVEQHMLRLADAPFAKDDAELVPSAGPCSTCPKRSGAQPELFADVSAKDGDLCLDPPCFQKKKEAAWRRRAADAEAKGLKVVEGKAAEKALSYSSEFVRLDSACQRDPKYRNWKQLIGKVAKDQVVLARDEHGDVHELVPKKATNALLKKAGHDFKAGRPSGGAGSARAGESAKERESREVRDAARHAVAAAFVTKLKTKKPDLALWKLTAGQMGADFGDEVFERRLGEEKAFDAKTRKGHIEQLDAEQLQALVLELALEPILYREGYSSDGKTAHQALLKWAGIDPKKIESAVKAQRAAASLAEQETWSLTPNARVVPAWVKDVTGIGTVKALAAKYGAGAKFARASSAPPKKKGKGAAHA